MSALETAVINVQKAIDELNLEINKADYVEIFQMFHDSYEIIVDDECINVDTSDGLLPNLKWSEVDYDELD